MCQLVLLDCCSGYSRCVSVCGVCLSVVCVCLWCVSVCGVCVCVCVCVVCVCVNLWICSYGSHLQAFGHRAPESYSYPHRKGGLGDLPSTG